MIFKFKKEIKWAKDWSRHFTKECMPISTESVVSILGHTRDAKESRNVTPQRVALDAGKDADNKNSCVLLAGMGQYKYFETWSGGFL